MKYINAGKLCKDLMTRWKIADEKKEKEIQSIMADIVVPIVVEQPAADVVEVKHGKWEYVNQNMKACSLCKRAEYAIVYDFCPHCGADMRERKHTEDQERRQTE